MGTDPVDAASGQLEATALDVTLRDVKLFDRTAARVDGSLTGVRIIEGGIALITVKRIDIAGPPSNLVATLTIDSAEARRRAVVAIQAVTGTSPTSLTLTAPDRISAVIGGVALSGRLVVQNGSLGEQSLLNGILDAGNGFGLPAGEGSDANKILDGVF